MAAQLLRHRFTVHEYHRMGQAGILREEDRLELLEGEILEMAPIGSRHQATVDRLTERFSSRVAGEATVRVQGPVRLGDISEPQPDVALLRRREDFYVTIRIRRQTTYRKFIFFYSYISYHLIVSYLVYKAMINLG